MLLIVTLTTIDSTTAAIIDLIATITEMDRQTKSLRELHHQIETQILAITIQLIEWIATTLIGCLLRTKLVLETHQLIEVL